MLYLCSENGLKNIKVKEWKLVYTPQNPVLEEMLDRAAKSLHLNGVVGANDTDELISKMFNREFVAGIEFNHPAVNFL